MTPRAIAAGSVRPSPGTAPTPKPLDVLRESGPHRCLLRLSDEHWAAWEALPEAERLVLTLRDDHPLWDDAALMLAAKHDLLRRDRNRHPQVARVLARNAVEATRGILDHAHGKVGR